MHVAVMTCSQNFSGRNIAQPRYTRSNTETMPEMMTLRAGTLDDSNDLKIAMHIWTGSARPWSHIDPDAKQHPGQP